MPGQGRSPQAGAPGNSAFLQITSASKYGPDLSKEALGGREAVMRDVA